MIKNIYFYPLKILILNQNYCLLMVLVMPKKQNPRQLKDKDIEKSMAYSTDS
jgi:hypothetical protein